MKLDYVGTTADWPRLAAAWEEASPQTILRWALDHFGPRLTLGTGLGPSGLVLLHMLRELTPNPDVFFLDTGLHFDETLALLRRVEARLDVRVRRLQPDQSIAEQGAVHGPDLWARDPDRCCHLRKVQPLRAHLGRYDAWLTAVRRDQGPSRAHLAIARYVPSYGVLKLCPLATWTREMVWTYVRAYDLPVNPLHERGYPSVGCTPCTTPTAPDAPERAGRWVGFAKTECGLHTA